MAIDKVNSYLKFFYDGGTRLVSGVGRLLTATIFGTPQNEVEERALSIKDKFMCHHCEMIGRCVELNCGDILCAHCFEDDHQVCSVCGQYIIEFRYLD